jgi:ribose 5-phosphate isomerase A
MKPEGPALSPDDIKRVVAEEAVDRFVKDGMTVGLGTGSTAEFAIRKMGELVSGGYDLTCVATSVQSEALAASCGIEVLDLDQVGSIDVTIDGADEVDPEMQIIKGLGGALLREKIVAAATVKEVIIVGDGKIVDKLGTKSPLPVEVLPFGHEHTGHALKKLGCEPVLRTKDGRPFVTDSGNLVYDCRFDGIDRPFYLEMAINNIPGVIENGLFLNTAYEVLVCDGNGSIHAMAEAVNERLGGKEIRLL